MEISWSICYYFDNICLFFCGQTRQMFKDEIERLLEVVDMVMFVGQEGFDGVLQCFILDGEIHFAGEQSEEKL